jgi:hypothetical protein
MNNPSLRNAQPSIHHVMKSMKSLSKFPSTLRRVAMLGAVLATVNAPPAQSFDGTWFDFPGGGGLGVGGSYSLEGSISALDVGTLTGGSYSLTGSYWSAPAELSAGDSPPRLDVERSAAGLVLSWSFPSEGWTLEQAGELTRAPGEAAWSDAALPSAVRDGSRWTVTIPAPAGRAFFRLRFP